MKRILFVDDEKDILDALQNLLRKERHRWEMRFALGAAAALEEFRAAPFDVIVSDMRMPGIDGAALLRKIKDAYPATRRLVLSGQADWAAVAEVRTIAHEVLSKPCDAARLRAALEAAD